MLVVRVGGSTIADVAAAAPRSESTILNQPQQEFCNALKAARERRGLKLTDIADATKVCPSYFSALERNDLRVWPKGLFRRSFFRAYASTVGLPVEPMLEEFMRLFPEDDRTAPATAGEAMPQPALVLDASWHGTRAPLVLRCIAATADLLAIALPALALVWWGAASIGGALAVGAVLYFTASTLLLGETPALFCLNRRERIVAWWRTVAPVRTAAEPTATEPGEDRPWFSDARRVRPRGQAPGLRVRFKVSS